MTVKVYTSSRGKNIDMGALRLKNEKVRAVGNMGVNSRGDRIDAKGNVIDSKSEQTQRRIQKQTNVSDSPVHSSSKSVKKEPVAQSPVADIPVINLEALSVPVETKSAPTTEGGLAGAIARAKTKPAGKN